MNAASVLRRVTARFDPGWLLALLVTGYVILATDTWHVPTPDGPLLVPLWEALVGFTCVLWLAVRRGITPVAYIAIAAIWGILLTDSTNFTSQALRDLHIYLKAGQHFIDGQAVYLTEPLRARPGDLSNYPFLYPPLTLPAFALLSPFPWPLVDAAWLAASTAIAVWSLRRFGLSWRWTLAALLWPPFMQGLYVGNVMVPLVALFAAAPFARRAAGLAVAPVFKIYSAITTLWLIREGRLLELAVGGAFVVFVALATLPMVGVGLWSDWLKGLGLYRESQPVLPNSLYGIGLPHYAPEWLWLLVATVVVVLALMARGREGLTRLGLATVIASPSLYAHGFVVATPAYLSLRSVWLWTAVAITGVAPGLGWWLAIALLIASWYVPALRRSSTREEVHPLADVLEPWPEVVEEAARAKAARRVATQPGLEPTSGAGQESEAAG